MLRDGLISRYETERKKQYAYSVLRSATVTRKAEPKDQPELVIPLPQKISFDHVEQLAKEFAWETNSDSVREFITYAKGRI